MDEFILIGDYHAEASDLDDAKALANYICKIAKTHPNATIIFLGDQYHTHAMLHVEVLKFWKDFFDELLYSSIKRSIVCLVGNHDKPGSTASQANSMLGHEDQVGIINQPCQIRDSIVLMPYMHDNDEFIRACNEFSKFETLICHQTFNGTIAENGFMVPNGIDQNSIPQKLIISGHIHAPQSFGKVWYPGAPRWRTLSDANISRAIYYIKINDNQIIERTEYHTNEVCRRIWHLYHKLDFSNVDLNKFNTKDRYFIDITGPADWIETQIPLFKDKARIRTFKDKINKPLVKESDGLDLAFKKWTDSYMPEYGTDINLLKIMIKERVGRDF